MLSVAVLGEVEATRDGVRLPLPAGKTSDLLVRLAVQPGRPVRVDTLIEDLWGEPVDRNTLQAKVSQLRRVLGRDAVTGSPDAYTLALDPGAVDASRATALADEVARAAAAGRPEDVVTAATSGLALFRGTPLTGQGDWAAPHRTALEELRWSLVEELVDARGALGAGGELVAELERLVAEQPLRERLWSALMGALYRAGRQADALAAYGRARSYLLDELGVEPGPELRRLEQQVLAQGEALPVAERDRTRVQGNLPAPGTPLVGRDRELDDLVRRTREHRLVTLAGLAGVGKTRLAVEAARATAGTGGAWIVRLDGVPATAGLADLLEVVAGTLFVVPDPDALREWLRGAPTLLVLDNCEHLVDAAAELARWLLAASPWVRLVATSQLPLGTDDEQVLDVAPLPAASAEDLFERLLTSARRAPASPADRRLVAEVCAALDGLPLAIELAAARVRSLPLDEIARRLDDRFALLRDPSRPHDRRHALEAALSWSYDLLFPDDQRALQALSCFPGGATLPAVEAVMSALGVPEPAVADTLARTVERSLVVLDSSAPVPRYRLLDSVRTHAGDRLRESGDGDRAAAAHAAWYADRADACAAQVRGAAQPAWLEFVRSERSGVDAALAWAAGHDTGAGARIALGLGWAWAVLGDGSAGAARIRAAVAHETAAEVRARASLVAAWLEASAGDLALAHRDWESAAALAVDDPRLLADLGWTRAFVAIQDGDPSTVLAAASASLVAYRELDLAWESGAALLLLAHGSLMAGDAPAASVHVHEALALLEGTGDRWGLLHARGILAGVAAGEGRLLDAADALADAAGTAETMGFAGQAALHLASRARLLAVLGEPTAGDALEVALDAAGAVGDGRVATGLRVHAAQLARLTGDDTTARRLLEENRAWFDAHGGGDRVALTEVLLAAVDGDVPRLTAHAETAPDPAARQAALDALARLAERAGDHAAAEALTIEADAVAVPAPDVVPRV